MLQEEIVREAQTMRQQAHPNVLTLHCSFVHDRQLWMVRRFTLCQQLTGDVNLIQTIPQYNLKDHQRAAESC